MSKTVPTFDPRIIERFAESLYRKATAFLMGSVVAGVVLGMAFGAVPLTSLGSAWPVPSYLGFATMLLGGVFGGVIGYSIGDARSFGYRLQAQTTLLQLEMERNGAEAAYLLQLLVEGKKLPLDGDRPSHGSRAPAPSAAAVPQRDPAPAPAPAPRPEAAPAPAPAPAPASSPPPARAPEPPLSPPVSGPSVAAVR